MDTFCSVELDYFINKFVPFENQKECDIVLEGSTRKIRNFVFFNEFFNSIF